MNPRWLLLGLLLGESWARAAACCGGSGSLPALITGDDRAQISGAIAYAAVVGQAFSSGLPVFYDASHSQNLKTFSLASAYRFADRFQAGVEVPVVTSARAATFDSSVKTGLGDIKADVAFEALPEWSYSNWRPRGFVFVQVSAPTGKSVLEASDGLVADATGRGVWSVAPGAHFLKAWGDWDAYATLALPYFFAGHVTASDGTDQNTSWGWGINGSLGAGYSFAAGAWRVGLSVNPVYESAKVVGGTLDAAPTSERLVWNALGQVSYMPSNLWSLALAYMDQTLLGPVHNVQLSRSVSFSAQRRWEL